MVQTIKITSPANGATVKEKVTVKVATTGVTEVIFYVDGVRVGVDTAAPFTHVVDTTTRMNGSHTIKATSGNGAVSSSVSVNIQNVVAKVLTADFKVT